MALTGRIKYFPAVSLFNAVATLAFIIPACFHSVHAVVWAQLAAAVVAAMSSVWLHQRIIGLDWRALARECLFLTVPIVVLVCVSLTMRSNVPLYFQSPSWALAATVALGAISYAGAVVLLRREIVTGILDAARSLRLSAGASTGVSMKNASVAK
ncbi:MAG: hypothetical protein R3D67_17585 [Hyphomicrobiaceae bacterium]